MKIKGVNSGKLDRISGARVNSGKGRAARGGKSRSTGSDDVAISSAARLSGLAGEAVANAPEIRAELVESIKEALESGSYSVSNLEVADRILRQVLMEGKRSL
ncbi:MAG: flagellar biosynthesis anti-sigma factor FlgM [Magnetococcales bacterium]|nr:flagellar biosynthesis anti-sigma factor FlgM [Magnetococcales bacterium]